MWSCWAPQTPRTWWGRGWGRTRAISLGLWKKQLQERWRCSESVEKGAAREDIPDTSKAPVKSQYQDFPKRKNDGRREIPLCAHLYVVVVVAKGKSNGFSKKKNPHGLYPSAAMCSWGDTLSQGTGLQGGHWSQSCRGLTLHGPSGKALLWASRETDVLPTLITAVVLMDLDKSLHVSVPLFSSCKMEIIIFTFFMKRLANARQQLSTTMIIV